WGNGRLERSNGFVLCSVYSLFSSKRFFPAVHSGCNFLGSSSVRCSSLAIWPLVLVSDNVAAPERSEKAFDAIAKLVDSSIIFSLPGWLDLDPRHTQVRSRYPKSSVERSRPFCF